MTTPDPPTPETGGPRFAGRTAADDPDMDALLDMLEERGVDPPSVTARARSIVTASAPRATAARRRVAAGGRRVADAASVSGLLVLVTLLAVLVVVAETTARAVAACHLPGRSRTCAKAVAAWDVPRRARAWRVRARTWTDHVLAWPARVDRPI